MGSKWEYIPLGELITLQRGHDLPSQYRIDGSVPIMGSSGITGFHNIAKATGPGVIVGRSGDSMGVVSFIEKDYWPLNTCLYITDFKGNDITYIYYLLKLVNFDIFNSGSAQKSLNRNAVYPHKVLATKDRELQKKIGAILSSFEERIINSNKINQTLEQMSQTLFKSWFVDFDPVIDNALDAGNLIPEALQSRAELRQKVRSSADFKPLPADIRALFPAEFEETEMGWVPTEWKNGNLSDVTKILSGFAFKSKDFGDNGKSVIKIKNITSAKTIDVDDTQKISEFIAKDANRFLLFDGDILMAMTGATVGKFGVLTTKNNEEYYLNQRVAKFETENKAYLYCVLNQESTDRFITNAAQGSAQPNISAKDILSMPLLIPSVELINTFNDFISHIFYRMITNTKANLNLTALRDTLLPKLISGELSLEDLPDIIKQTEAA